MLSHLSQLGNNIQQEKFSLFQALEVRKFFLKASFTKNIFIGFLKHLKVVNERKDTYLEFKSQLADRGIDPGVRGLGSMEFGRW